MEGDSIMEGTLQIIVGVIMIFLMGYMVVKRSKIERKKEVALRDTIIKVIQELQHELKVTESEKERERLEKQLRMLMGAVDEYYGRKS